MQSEHDLNVYWLEVVFFKNIFHIVIMKLSHSYVLCICASRWLNAYHKFANCLAAVQYQPVLEPSHSSKTPLSREHLVSFTQQVSQSPSAECNGDMEEGVQHTLISIFLWAGVDVELFFQVLPLLGSAFPSEANVYSPPVYTQGGDQYVIPQETFND